jgi:hypothetical protein
VACLLAGLGRPVAGGVVIETRLRSEHEDRWRELARRAGTGAVDVDVIGCALAMNSIALHRPLPSAYAA